MQERIYSRVCIEEKKSKSWVSEKMDAKATMNERGEKQVNEALILISSH